MTDIDQTRTHIKSIAVVAWLLERTRNHEHDYDEIYLAVDKSGSLRWTVDAFKALRFARKEDAEAAWRVFYIMKDSTGEHIQVTGRDAVAEEHMFYE